jgi:hypothetical protein
MARIARALSASPYALVIFVYAIGFTIIGSALIQHFGFPLDDSWIHQSVGRNFAEFGSLGYLPDERSSGSTSLLWTAILAVNYRLLPGLSPVLFTLLLNVACAIATALILLRIGLRDGLSKPLAVLLAIAPAFDGNYLWLAFTGMEHMLFVTLSVAIIWLWMAPASSGRAAWANTLAAGLCMGLLGMTRPEGIVLPGALLAASVMFARARTRSTAQVATAATIFVVLACLPLAVNLYGSQSLLPVTMKGRQWMLVSDAASRFQAELRLPEQWGTRVFKAIIPFAGGELDRSGQIVLLLALLPVIALAGVGVRALVARRAWRLLAVCGWGLLHALLYLIILPSIGHGGRYQPFLLLLLLPLLFIGAAHLLERYQRAAIALPAAGLLAFGAASLLVWRAVLASGIDHIAHTHGVVAAWLEKNMPTRTVAVFDIGRIGYQRGASGDPHIIDLGGLTDPVYLSYLYGGQVPRYLAAHGIHYVVLPTDTGGQSAIGHRLRLTDNVEVERKSLFRACSTLEDWRLGWIETGNAVQCQEVDSVKFVTEAGSYARAPQSGRAGL